MNKTNGSIIMSCYTVNTTFSDQVVKHTLTIDPNDLCTTAEIEFSISPVSVSGHLLPMINIAYLITPSCEFND